MPRTFTQTVNAAKMFNIIPSIDMATFTMTLTSGYVVGYYDTNTGSFGVIQGAANSDTASVIVALTTTLAGANIALQQLIATQEGLDLTLGDHVLPPT